MSTIEKLFVQIFDRKRQIIQQLNHQKQLYDQNLASKLLIQGITPPPWLLNSDKFASYSASSSDPTELNKEELISGLLLPCPQPVLSYCNATHLYGQPLSTVGNGDIQHDLFNATDHRGKGLDDCRPGHSPQCLSKGLEDVQHHVAETPQERGASDTYADLDQSLARIQRSKSRQKALELRSSRKLSVKCQLEDDPSTAPRRQDASNECASTTGEVLSTSKDIFLKKQDETDAPSNMMSPPSHCRDMSVDLLKESIVGSDESKSANVDLFKDELIDSQCVFREEDNCTSKSKSDDAQNTGDAERLVAIELPENIIDHVRRPASLCGPPSYFHESHGSDRKRNVHHSAPVGGFKKTNLRDTSVLSGISRVIVADAPINLLSPHSDCQDLPLDESITAAVSFSSKQGISAPVGVLEQPKIRDIPAQIDITGQIFEGDLRCTAIEKDAQTNLLSPNGVCRELYVEESLVAEDSVSSKGGISRNLHKESTDHRKSSNFNLLTEDLRDISFCHIKELEASSDLLSSEKHIEIDASTNLMSLVAEDSVSSKGGISRHPHKESVDMDEFCDRKCANSNLLTEDLRENHGLSNEEDVSLCHAEEPEASSDLLSPEKHIAQPELDQSNSPSSKRVNCITNSKVLEETAADGALVDNLLHMDKGEGLKLSPQELTSELDLENQCDLSSGKDIRESQRRYGASVDQCETVERSGETVNELASSSSEDSMKHASVESPKEDTCYSKEDKISISPKLLELQTLGTKSSPRSSLGGSWPKKRRRIIKSITSRSASPHLRVNSSSISSSEVYVANSSTGDFSATEIFQNDTTSLGHSSIRQHKEEKLSSQGSTDVDPEELQVHSVSCLTQQLTAIPQDWLHGDDRSTEKVDGDPTDNKIWQGGNSLEVHNIHNCLNEEAVGAEGQRASLECFTFDKKLQNPHGEIDADVSDILLSSSTASPLENRDTVGRKTSMADLMNFTFYSECKDTDDTGDLEKLVAIDLPKNAIDRAEFLERLCRSASLGVPFSDLHASYISDVKEGVCHSVPARVFDQKDSRYTSTVSDSTSHTYTGNVENSEFQGNLFSDHSPTNGTPFAWYCKGPYASPFEKSRSSSNCCSSNPELTCFPIEENGEEDGSTDDSDHDCPEETASEEYMDDVALDPVSEIVNLGSVSTCIPEEEEISKQNVDVVAPQACQETLDSARKPLCDISKQETESVSKRSKRSEVDRKISQNSEAQPYQSGLLKKRKVTQNASSGTSGKKNFESRPTRFSKSKASLKSGMETRGGSSSVKEAKPSNNIVSSIKSFLPLVHQKQAASCAPVKKEVRVKALEAAEAAKRLAEKRENERNQKKEALKLERARVEQEKVRQLGLVKKAKEEEKKRKEAEIAERKRKREEEEQERKEKENKRKRIGEARKQKKGHDDKIHLEKQESNSQTQDAKTDTGLQKNLVNSKEQKDFLANVAGCSTPTPDVTTQTIREKSYDISPYCCSDEEDEEDDLPNNKFIPAWASKSNIKTALASLDNLDPVVIFPPSTFCSLNEVLLPRVPKQR